MGEYKHTGLLVQRVCAKRTDCRTGSGQDDASNLWDPWDLLAITIRLCLFINVLVLTVHMPTADIPRLRFILYVLLSFHLHGHEVNSVSHTLTRSPALVCLFIPFP